MVNRFGKFDQLLDLIRQLGSVKSCSVAEASAAGGGSFTHLDERHFDTPTTQLARPHPQQFALEFDYCIRLHEVVRPREIFTSKMSD